MDKLSFEDLSTASLVYYIASHSEEGWADKSYKKFYIDCGNELIEYTEKGNKKALKKIIQCLADFLKSWHSLRGADINKFQQQLETFLSNDENAMKIKKFHKKDIEKSSLGDIKASGELYESIMGVSGIGPTNASKILHVLCPKFFVMWDRKIREKHIGKNCNSEAYIEFLCLMKNKMPIVQDTNQLKNIGEILENKPCEKTMAKLIDEYNFITITKGIDLKKINLIIKKLFT